MNPPSSEYNASDYAIPALFYDTSEHALITE